MFNESIWFRRVNPACFRHTQSVLVTMYFTHFLEGAARRWEQAGMPWQYTPLCFPVEHKGYLSLQAPSDSLLLDANFMTFPEKKMKEKKKKLPLWSWLQLKSPSRRNWLHTSTAMLTEWHSLSKNIPFTGNGLLLSSISCQNTLD